LGRSGSACDCAARKSRSVSETYIPGATLNPFTSPHNVALDVVLTLIRPWALNRARGHSRSHHDAEDIVQEAYLCAWVRFDKGFPPTTHSLSAWLSVVIRRLSGRAQRTRHATLIIVPLDLDMSEQQELVPDTELGDYLIRVPVDEAEVLRLHYGQGLTCMEVCRVLHVPVGTVRSRLNRGLEHLRRTVPAIETSRRMPEHRGRHLGGTATQQIMRVGGSESRERESEGHNTEYMRKCHSSRTPKACKSTSAGLEVDGPRPPRTLPVLGK
jgi:RNA polymerase sigma-70 factor (ECF subfamily)